MQSNKSSKVIFISDFDGIFTMPYYSYPDHIDDLDSRSKVKYFRIHITLFMDYIFENNLVNEFIVLTGDNSKQTKIHIDYINSRKKVNNKVKLVICDNDKKAKWIEDNIDLTDNIVLYIGDDIYDLDVAKLLNKNNQICFTVKDAPFFVKKNTNFNILDDITESIEYLKAIKTNKAFKKLKRNKL